MNGISLAMALIANLALLLNMARRLSFAIVRTPFPTFGLTSSLDNQKSCESLSQDSIM